MISSEKRPHGRQESPGNQASGEKNPPSKKVAQSTQTCTLCCEKYPEISLSALLENPPQGKNQSEKELCVRATSDMAAFCLECLSEPSYKQYFHYKTGEETVLIKIATPPEELSAKVFHAISVIPCPPPQEVVGREVVKLSEKDRHQAEKDMQLAIDMGEMSLCPNENCKQQYFRGNACPVIICPKESCKTRFCSICSTTFSLGESVVHDCPTAIRCTQCDMTIKEYSPNNSLMLRCCITANAHLFCKICKNPWDDPHKKLEGKECPVKMPVEKEQSAPQ